MYIYSFPSNFQSRFRINDGLTPDCIISQISQIMEYSVGYSPSLRPGGDVKKGNAKKGTGKQLDEECEQMKAT